MNKKQYEKDLKQKQEEHLKQIKPFIPPPSSDNWRPCLHDSCPECVGTGIKKNGSICVHNISCPCPKCTPYCCTADLTGNINIKG